MSSSDLEKVEMDLKHSGLFHTIIWCTKAHHVYFNYTGNLMNDVSLANKKENRFLV